MKIEGSNLSIGKAKKMLDIVVDSAKRDYAEYKERKAQRGEKHTRNRMFSRKKEEEETRTKTCGSKKSSNGFAALFEESESDTGSDSGVEEYPALGNQKTTADEVTYWGSGMNPEPKQKEETPITSWGDVSEDE
jgi:hypothetical protein